MSLYKNILSFSLFVLLVSSSCKNEPKPSIETKVETEETIDYEQIERELEEDESNVESELVTDSVDASITVSQEKPAQKEIIKEERPQKVMPKRQKKKMISKPSKNTSTSTTTKPKPPTKKLTSMTFETMQIDFGEITEGDVISKKFKFINAGKYPLTIAGTSATCGCTRPAFPFLDIAPGVTDEITVTYNSVGKNGPQTAEIFVEANTNPKTTVLKLKGVVKPKPNDDNEEEKNGNNTNSSDNGTNTSDVNSSLEEQSNKGDNTSNTKTDASDFKKGKLPSSPNNSTDDSTSGTKVIGKKGGGSSSKTGKTGGIEGKSSSGSSIELKKPKSGGGL